MGMSKRWIGQFALACATAAVIGGAALWIASGRHEVPSGDGFAIATPLAVPAVSLAIPAEPATGSPAPDGRSGVRSKVHSKIARQKANPDSASLVVARTEPGRHPTEGSAVLGSGAGSPRVYAPGSILGDGARLLEVHGDHVVLESEGRPVRLSSRRALREQRLQSSAVVPGPSSDETLVRAAPSSTETLTHYFRPTPEFHNDRLIGYRIYSGTQAEASYHVGFKPGDLWIAIDGEPITSAEQITDSFRQFTSGKAMVATVERNGQTAYVQLGNADPAQ